MQLMHWFVEYADGTTLKEKENEFHDIEKDKIKYFGMTGQDTAFKHDVENGSHVVNNKEVIFLLDGEQIGKSKDVINFKEKMHVAFKRGNIIGYYTGWKEKSENFSYIEVLFWVDMKNQQLKVRLRLTPRENLECNFGIKIDGKLQEKKLKFEELGRKKQFTFKL